MSRRVTAVALLLLIVFGVRLWLNASAPLPARRALADMPAQIGPWTSLGDITLEQGVQGVLQSDDTLNRNYRDANGNHVNLFIAYYKLQKAGESMHSPKNCLPGSGYTPVSSDEVDLGVGGKRQMINRYVVERSGAQSLVLYWYQSNGRVIASEYWGKFYLVWDGMRTRRRDGGIVRLVVPVGKGENLNAATERALGLGRAVYSQLPNYLPN